MSTKKNEGVPYVNLTIKNTSVGTTADTSGRFTLDHEQKFPFTILITSTGYRPGELVVKNGNTNEVTIRLEAIFHRDTVVITSRRRSEMLQDVPTEVFLILRLA